MQCSQFYFFLFHLQPMWHVTTVHACSMYHRLIVYFLRYGMLQTEMALLQCFMVIAVMYLVYSFRRWNCVSVQYFNLECREKTERTTVKSCSRRAILYDKISVAPYWVMLECNEKASYQAAVVARATMSDHQMTQEALAFSKSAIRLSTIHNAVWLKTIIWHNSLCYCTF